MFAFLVDTLDAKRPDKVVDEEDRTALVLHHHRNPLEDCGVMLLDALFLESL